MTRSPRSILLVFGLIAALAAGVSARQVEAPPGDQQPTVQSVQGTLERVREDADLGEEAREQAIDLYTEAIEHLKAAENARGRAAEFRKLAEQAASRLASIREELGAPAPDPKVTAPTDASLDELEQRSSEAAAELQKARESLEELEGEASRRSERRSSIPKLLSDLREELRLIEEELANEALATPAGELERARRTLLQARAASRRAEIEALEAEIASYEARRELLPARRDRAARRVAQAEKIANQWQQIVSQRREAEAREAEQRAREIRDELATSNPALQEYAEQSAELAALRSGEEGLASKINRVERLITERRDKLSSLRSQFRSLSERLEASGLNKATGVYLRRFFDSLPETKKLVRERDEVQERIEDTEFEVIERREQRREIGDVEAAARDLVERARRAAPNGKTRQLERVARELVVTRRDLLDGVLADLQKYSDDLLRLDLATRELLEATRAYESYVSERILWVRSVPESRKPSLENTLHALRWLLNAEQWSRAADLSWQWIGRAPLVNGAFAVVLGALALGRRRLVRLLRSIERDVSSYRTDAFVLSVKAIGVTVGLALPVPFLLWWVGDILIAPPDQVEVALAIGTSLQSTAWQFFLPLFVLMEALRPGGLVIAHYRWQERPARLARRRILRFTLVIAPLVVLVTALSRFGDEAANASLGRAANTLAMLTLLALLIRVAHPRGQIVKELLRNESGNWIDRYKFLWFGVLIALPLLFIVLTWLGYYYTAVVLEGEFIRSAFLILFLVLANGLLHRWVFVARRRIAMEEARRKREAAHTAAEHAASRAREPSVSIDEGQVDLPAISLQTRQLFATGIVIALFVGLYAIWDDTLPALNIFDRMQVWPTMEILEDAPPVFVPAEPAAPEAAPAPPQNGADGAGGLGQYTPQGMLAGGQTAGAGEPLATSVTVSDIIGAFIVLVATWVAFRHVPALFGMVVLQRLPLDAGSRYALSTVLRYIIAIVGILIAFGMVNLSWSKVQWLAAALTFGLAFGLQEIFANFVSGLIILGERPFRIGDTVTVGNISGTVSRIKMRATTITDWDMKELVVPNKTFITGDVINWSLTDPVLRVIVPVGVSYGSDVDLVERLLLEVADECEHVLDEPAPRALFLGFGDSTLNFDLRAYIPSIEYFLTTKSLLHNAIIKKFREHGVEIAFPQRDLHVRSIGELRDVLPDGRRGAGPGGG